MEKRFVYADNAATTKLSKTAYEAMLPYLTEQYFNPSSLYSPSKKVKLALEDARQTVADCIGAEANEVYFTSGGSESDNFAIKSAAQLIREKGKSHIVTSSIEHHAILKTLQGLQPFYSFTFLKPERYEGIILPGYLADAICKDTGLVSIMMLNNETGAIQMIREYGLICRRKNILFHTDAVQAAGHIRIDVNHLQVDMLSISGHKFHGPKGTGALYVRSGIPLYPLIHGGKQEKGRRAGTENVAGAVGLAAALKENCDHMSENYQKIKQMNDRLVYGLIQIPKTHINSNRIQSYPGIINASFEGVEGESLVYLLDLQGICVSAGSACAAGSPDPSHVLTAMGFSSDYAHSSIRISIGDYNTMDDIDYMLQEIPKAVEKLRQASPFYNKTKS